MSRHPAVDLLELVLHRLPSLPDALCRNRWELFDSEQPGDVAVALALCRRCPHLAECHAWSGRMNQRSRPPGVVGGRRPIKRRQPRGSVAARSDSLDAKNPPPG